MKNLTRQLLYHGDHIERQNMLWNTAGSFVYALASMVLSFLVMRIVGEDQGGIFSFGFSTLGQQMFIIAYFGIRPFHVTDTGGEYSFGDYLRHRIITSSAALTAGVLFLTCMRVSGRYPARKCMILILLVIYKVIDGYADVYESEFQRQESLYLTGKSTFFRTLLSVFTFLAVLCLSRRLLLACTAAVLAQAAGVSLFDRDVIHALPRVDLRRKKGQTSRLFGSTVFLFAGVFLDFYVFSAAKYAIDARMTNAASGYFNLIFMPTSVIYMVANFIIRPFLTRMTNHWNDGHLELFKKELLRLGAVILGLTALAAGAALLLGKWVLGIMELLLGSGYEGKLSIYSRAFTVIILGGGFYALANLMYYALVIMRKQRTIFLVYFTAAAAAAILSEILVSAFGMNGAAGCYLLLMTGLLLGFGLCTMGVYRQKQNKISASKGENR